MAEISVQELVLKANNFFKFNPMQEKSLSGGLLENSVVVSSPTASGKTVLAELKALHSILNSGKKVVYTCPLKALASEHFHDFQKKYSKELKIKMALSTGDFDSGAGFLGRFDLIFTTYEKVESLLRHKA
ncbi:MAG: DEAD/DEAH box helicase, partial [Candidatus Diapherotrites archaeon]|nr:DEAD/DEAH box helicase [Candidatus Diapherotrites archaeon]